MWTQVHDWSLQHQKEKNVTFRDQGGNGDYQDMGPCLAKARQIFNNKHN